MAKKIFRKLGFMGIKVKGVPTQVLEHIPSGKRFIDTPNNRRSIRSEWKIMQSGKYITKHKWKRKGNK